MWEVVLHIYRWYDDLYGFLDHSVEFKRVNEILNFSLKHRAQNQFLLSIQTKTTVMYKWHRRHTREAHRSSCNRGACVSPHRLTRWMTGTFYVYPSRTPPTVGLFRATTTTSTILSNEIEVVCSISWSKDRSPTISSHDDDDLMTVVREAVKTIAQQGTPSCDREGRETVVIIPHTFFLPSLPWKKLSDLLQPKKEDKGDSRK